jgi:putative SOS response-associated peptidase YedK
LWERWQYPQKETGETSTFLTTEANELMRAWQDRMLILLDAASDGVWLDPRASADSPYSLFVSPASERNE